MSELIQRLRADAQGINLGADGMGWSPNPDLLNEAATLIEQQAAEIERLRADAGRYRWLRHGDNDECVIDSIYPRSMWENTHWLLRNEKLDAAIDAAVSQAKDGAR